MGRRRYSKILRFDLAAFEVLDRVLSSCRQAAVDDETFAFANFRDCGVVAVAGR